MAKRPASPCPPPRRLQNTGSPSRLGKQHQTILADRSTSAARIELPMTARLRSVIGSIHCQRARQGGQPAANGGGGLGAQRGQSRAAGSYLDGQSAAGGRRLEAIFISLVVADEDRPLAAEGRSVHEAVDGGCLADAGRLDLEHAAPANDLQLLRIDAGERLGDPPAKLPGIGACASIVNGEALAFVL